MELMIKELRVQEDMVVELMVEEFMVEEREDDSNRYKLTVKLSMAYKL